MRACLVAFCMIAATAAARADSPAAPDAEGAATEAAAAPAAGHAAPHWSYAGEGGPENWGRLSPDYAACVGGVQQSPVDITTRATISAEAPALALAWQPFRPEIVDNGHTVQVNTGGAGGHATLGGVLFQLEQFHFHHRSEHAVDGARAPMEAHFVHRAADGRLLVVGSLIVEGDANPSLGAILAGLGPEGSTSQGAQLVDPMALVTVGDDAYRYAGSLTTPPCSEVVTWHVMAAPVTAGAAQIAAFAARYPGNARPLQDVNRRFILRTD